MLGFVGDVDEGCSAGPGKNVDFAAPGLIRVVLLGQMGKRCHDWSKRRRLERDVGLIGSCCR